MKAKMCTGSGMTDVSLKQFVDNDSFLPRVTNNFIQTKLSECRRDARACSAVAAFGSILASLLSITELRTPPCRLVCVYAQVE